MKIKLTILGFSLFLTGCFDPTIDASSRQSLKTSMEQVKSELPVAQQRELDFAIMVLHDAVKGELILEGKAANRRTVEQEVLNRIDGKSAKQIVNLVSG